MKYLINKSTLKTLRTKYLIEMLKGNNSHMTDLIATQVLLDLTKFSIGYIKNKEVGEITLNDLTNMYIFSQDELKIPTAQEILEIKMRYKKEIREKEILIVERSAALSWIAMMVVFGMLEEGQIINPNQYFLSDFMTDEILLSIFKINKNQPHNIKQKVWKVGKLSKTTFEYE